MILIQHSVTDFNEVMFQSCCVCCLLCVLVTVSCAVTCIYKHKSWFLIWFCT